jgi:hypothetical protein
LERITMQLTGGQVTVKITTGATSLYMGAARRFMLEAHALDDRTKSDAESEADRIERSHALIETTLAAVVLSYTAVESVLNELFQEREHFDQPVWFPNLNEKIALSLRRAWSEGIEKLNPIDKAKVALAIADRSIAWGEGSPQEFLLLHALRNALVHHKPHSVEPSVTEDKLEKRLRNRFELSRIWAGKNVNFRWGGALGAGCAQWAYRTAEHFQSDFFSSLGCEYPKPWPLASGESPALDAPTRET